MHKNISDYQTHISLSTSGEVVREGVASLATMRMFLFLTTVFLCADVSHSFKPFLAKPKFVQAKSDERSLRMAGGNTEGRLLTVNDIASNGRCYLNLGMPRVLPPGKADEDWLLWFHARDDQLADDVVKLSTGRILFASSKDGLSGWNFHEDSPVLNPNKENDGDWYFFDSEHVGLGDVIQPGEKANEKFATQDGVFLMYIFGGCSDSVNVDGGSAVKGVKMEIGVAVSQDGAHWSRLEGPEPYGSVVSPGKTSDEFDSQFIGWPCVVEDGSEYRMYYHTYNPKVKKFVVGLAVAKDGLLKWTKMGPVFDGGDGDSFDAGGAARRHVVRTTEGTYRMWYEAISKDGAHSIGIATSTDGLQWVRNSDQPVFTASNDAGAWDGGGVGSPHLIWIPDIKRWRMYYVGTPVLSIGSTALPASSIGVAESLDEAGTFFKRLNV